MTRKSFSGSVSLSMPNSTSSPDEALESDSIDDTVNYGVAFTVIEEIVTGKRRYLIEALALDIAKGLCSRFPQIQRAKITIRKPNAPVPGVLDYVQVSVEHFA